MLHADYFRLIHAAKDAYAITFAASYMLRRYCQPECQSIIAML